MLALSAALPLALFGWTAWDERGRALREAEQAAVRTVSALHEHAAKVLETHELVLAEVSRQIEGRSWDEVERDAALWRYLLRIVRDLDQIAGITLVDGGGRVRMTTAAFPAPANATAGGRGFFRHGSDGGTGTYIGPSRADPEGNNATIALSRRLSAPEGAFNGVVHVAVPVAHFTAFWERFAPTVAHVIPLVRSDGQVIARYPALATPERLSTAGPFLSRALARREGTYRAVSQVDGVERLNAYTQVKDYPLHISFSVETRAVLAAWRERIALLGVYSGLAAAALVGMTAAVIRQHHEQRAASERWRATADRLAAEMAAREGAEAALRRAQTLEAVGQLTAGVAHDFNNLLQAIRSGLFLIRKRAPAEAGIGGVLDASLQAVDRGAKLVQQLMVFARREKLEPRPVDLRALLAGMGELLRKAVGTGVRIEAEVAEDLHPALVDPTGTELAVLNLAINARDAMGGEGRLTLAARNLHLPQPDAATGLSPGDYVVLSVSDTGAGMPPEVAERALEPFFTTKPVGKGTGLGLSMVHGFVSQSGGGVRIESEPGRGTTLSLYLPRATGAVPEAGPAAPAEGEAAGGVRRGATVLLVDDDALGRMATAAALRELGHEVLEARDGGEGLSVLGRNPGVALLVTDYAMPGMNGAEFAAAARAARPDLPVVVVTGYAAEGLDDLGRVADAVLRKPFRVEDLDAGIRAVLRARARSLRAAVA